MTDAGEKILITGGAGFIGAHLAARLAKSGADVDLLDNLSYSSFDCFLDSVVCQENVNLIQTDLSELDAMRSCRRDYTTIFHLAAIVGVESVTRKPYETLSQHALTLDRIIEFAKSLPTLRRFVFASTSEVYAGSLETIGLTFPTPTDHVLVLPDLTRRRTCYMLSKIYGEAMIHHSNLPYTIVRPHNIFGPRMGLRHVIPELLHKAHQAESGSALQVLSPDHRRTFCYIDDAVGTLISLSRLDDSEGRVLNIGTDGPEYTMYDVAKLVIETVGKDISIEHGPTTEGSPKRRQPDTSETVALVGSDRTVDLSEGVRRTYDWYKKHVF